MTEETIPLAFMTEEIITPAEVPTFSVVEEETKDIELTKEAIMSFAAANTLGDLMEIKTVYDRIEDPEMRANYQPYVSDDDTICELYTANIEGVLSNFSGKVTDNIAADIVGLLHSSLNPDLNKFEKAICTQWQAQCKVLKNKITIELTKLK